MMPWAHQAEARLRMERRILGLDTEAARVLRKYIERQVRRMGRSIVTVELVKRLTDAWVTGEGED